MGAAESRAPPEPVITEKLTLSVSALRPNISSSKMHTCGVSLTAHNSSSRGDYNHFLLDLHISTELHSSDNHCTLDPLWGSDWIIWNLNNKKGTSWHDNKRSHFSLFWANTQFALSETAEYNRIKYNSYYKRRQTKAVPINQFSCLVKWQNLQERFWKHDPSVLIFKTYPFSQD